MTKSMAELVWLNKEQTKYTYKGFESRILFEIKQEIRHNGVTSRVTEVNYLEANIREWEVIIIKNGNLEKNTYKTLNGAKKRVLNFIPVEKIFEVGSVVA